jgi:hypothetical protein
LLVSAGVGGNPLAKSIMSAQEKKENGLVNTVDIRSSSQLAGTLMTEVANETWRKKER